MLTVSREATVKVGRHAWNVYPLEAFGYLLGRTSESAVLVALPNSKTSRWNNFDDRWAQIDNNLAIVKLIAARFRLEVVGYYCSTSVVTSPAISPPESIQDTSLALLLTYFNVCCPQCSSYTLTVGPRQLTHRIDYRVPRGKRSNPEVNQRRVHHSWREVWTIDYSNGYIGR